MRKKRRGVDTQRRSERRKPPALPEATQAWSAIQSTLLTRRQTDVLQLLLRGLSNREIATQLGISERAVKVHVSSLLQKFSVTSRSALIAKVLTALHSGERLRRTMSLRTKARSLSARFKPYEQSPFMVAVTLGPEHRFVFCNEVAARVARRTRDRIIGRTVKEIDPDFEARFGKALDKVYKTGIPVTVGGAATGYVSGDGTAPNLVLDLIFQPLRCTDGLIEGILHIGTEITHLISS